MADIFISYHQAFLLGQFFGMDALSAVQPDRLRLEPYQLVPVLRAILISRVRFILAYGRGLGKPGIGEKRRRGNI